ncbi:MAG: glycosyltransferase family 4 protein [Armatimonadota bacterium]
MRIAMITPLPPYPSGIADYSSELLSCLSAYVQITAYYLGENYTPHALKNVEMMPVSQFDASDGSYDAIILQIGNEAIFAEATDILNMRPCLVVLHDLNISGVYGYRYLSRGDWGAYLLEILRQEGLRAFLKSSLRFLVHRKLPDMLDYNMTSNVVRRANRLIVHSRAAKDILMQRYPEAQVSVVPHGVPEQAILAQSDICLAREALSIPRSAFAIASFGTIHDRKRITSLLTAIERFTQSNDDAYLFLVGGSSDYWTDSVERMGLSHRVRLTGRVEIEDFYRYMSAVDLCVNLRYPWLGEESGPLLRIMSCGKPVVVTNIGCFSEIPDDACFKVQPGECEVNELLSVFQTCISNRSVLQETGTAGREYASRYHSLDASAVAYMNACRAAGFSGRERVVR